MSKPSFFKHKRENAPCWGMPFRVWATANYYTDPEMKVAHILSDALHDENPENVLSVEIQALTDIMRAYLRTWCLRGYPNRVDTRLECAIFFDALQREHIYD